MNITLNFINTCNAPLNKGVVIFQKNVASPSDACIAWVVFQNPAKDVKNSFQLTLPSTVAASDSFGNLTPQLPAPNGTRFDMTSSVMGNQLRQSDQRASSPAVVEVYNELPVGAINAMIYNNGFLAAQKTNFGPGQKAAFVFEPALYLSLANGIQQGDLLDASITANPDLQFSLLGIRSADVVMCDGGTGPDAKPFTFTLQNIVMA